MGEGGGTAHDSTDNNRLDFNEKGGYYEYLHVIMLETCVLYYCNLFPATFGLAWFGQIPNQWENRNERFSTSKNTKDLNRKGSLSLSMKVTIEQSKKSYRWSESSQNLFSVPLHEGYMSFFHGCPHGILTTYLSGNENHSNRTTMTIGRWLETRPMTQLFLGIKLL